MVGELMGAAPMAQARRGRNSTCGSPSCAARLTAAATVAIRGLAIADTEVIPEAAVLPATVLRAVEAVVGT
jgi:hypothetical protein